MRSDSFILLYTDSERQEREAGPAPKDVLVSLFRASGAIKGELYRARSHAMHYAGLRPYPPVVIERLHREA